MRSRASSYQVGVIEEGRWGRAEVMRDQCEKSKKQKALWASDKNIERN